MKLFWSEDSSASGIDAALDAGDEARAPEDVLPLGGACPCAMTDTFLSTSRPTVSRLMTPIVLSSGNGRVLDVVLRAEQTGLLAA